MYRSLLLFLAFSLVAAGAQAQDLVFSIDNRSDKQVVGLTVMPTGQQDADAIAVTINVAAGESQEITLAIPDGRCVFDLTFSFADASSSVSPNTDLCQTDTLTLE